MSRLEENIVTALLYSLLPLVVWATPPAGSLPTPAPDDWETTWNRWIAQEIGGRSDVVLRDQRGICYPDIVTDRHAIEVDWCRRSKHLEALNQSMRYALASPTKRRPVALLLTGLKDAAYEHEVLEEARTEAELRRIPYLVLAFDVRCPAESLLLLRLKLQLPEPAEADP